MATILYDVSLLEGLTPIVVFLFVFVILYALFRKLGIFGESAGLDALISFAFAILFLIIADLRELISFFVPWVAVFLILIIVVLLAMMLLGFSQKDITEYLTENTGLSTAIAVIIVVIFIIAFTKVFPGSLGFPENGASGNADTIRRVIFHPKTLGVVFVLVVIGYIVRAVGFKK